MEIRGNQSQVTCIQDLMNCALQRILVCNNCARNQIDTIADGIEKRIVDGPLESSKCPDETPLVWQYDVTKMPLGEVFQRLSMSELVEKIPPRGAFARQPDLADVLQMFELMAELEASCASLAAMRILDVCPCRAPQKNQRRMQQTRFERGNRLLPPVKRAFSGHPLLRFQQRISQAQHP